MTDPIRGHGENLGSTRPGRYSRPGTCPAACDTRRPDPANNRTSRLPIEVAPFRDTRLPRSLLAGLRSETVHASRDAPRARRRKTLSSTSPRPRSRGFAVSDSTRRCCAPFATPASRNRVRPGRHRPRGPRRTRRPGPRPDRNRQDRGVRAGRSLHHLVAIAEKDEGSPPDPHAGPRADARARDAQIGRRASSMLRDAVHGHASYRVTVFGGVGQRAGRSMRCARASPDDAWSRLPRPPARPHGPGARSTSRAHRARSSSTRPIGCSTWASCHDIRRILRALPRTGRTCSSRRRCRRRSASSRPRALRSAARRRARASHGARRASSTSSVPVERGGQASPARLRSSARRRLPSTPRSSSRARSTGANKRLAPAARAARACAPSRCRATCRSRAARSAP